MNSPPKLLIAGASVRAAVQSAMRSGLRQMVAADLFNDLDLSAVCRVARLEPEYRNLAPIAQSVSADGWMYTGALENHPFLVAEVSQHIPLLGNGPETLRCVRDPVQLVQALRAARLPAADTVTSLPPSPDGTWLSKPHQSAAGISIRRCMSPQGTGDPGHYYQRFIEGKSRAGVFVGAAGCARLLGVTDQMIGRRDFGACGFVYCGSVGPVALSSEERSQWRRIGDCMASQFKLEGLFGVDAVVSSKGVFVVEVNPRYTASVEILERRADWSAIDFHIQACRRRMLPETDILPTDVQHGKAIVFARQAFQVSRQLLAMFADWNQQSDDLRVADIPPPYTQIEESSPVVTVFARGANEMEVLHQLAKRADEIYVAARP